MDLIWAELPFICTHGDVLAEEVERNGWGMVRPEEDPGALAGAIATLLDDSSLLARCRANLAAARPALQWDETLKPLVRFCSEPGPPVSAKWERMPGLAQRLATYTARRGVFNLYDRRLQREYRRQLAAEAAASPAGVGAVTP